MVHEFSKHSIVQYIQVSLYHQHIYFYTVYCMLPSLLMGTSLATSEMWCKIQQTGKFHSVLHFKNPQNFCHSQNITSITFRQMIYRPCSKIEYLKARFHELDVVTNVTSLLWHISEWINTEWEKKKSGLILPNLLAISSLQQTGSLRIFWYKILI